VKELELDEKLAQKIVAAASEEARRMASEKSRKQAEDIMDRERQERERLEAEEGLEGQQ